MLKIPLIHHNTIDQPLYLNLYGRILSGYEHNWALSLVMAHDISEYVYAEKREHEQRSLAEGMFHHSPTSLWVEDFSEIKLKLDHLRKSGIDDFRKFLDAHPDFITQCMLNIKVLDVNQATLDLFLATSKNHLIQNLHHVFYHEMHDTFRE